MTSAEEIREYLDLARWAAKNCGTGAGGFTLGNSCGRTGAGNSIEGGNRRILRQRARKQGRSLAVPGTAHSRQARRKRHGHARQSRLEHECRAGYRSYGVQESAAHAKLARGHAKERTELAHGLKADRKELRKDHAREVTSARRSIREERTGQRKDHARERVTLKRTQSKEEAKLSTRHAREDEKLGKRHAAQAEKHGPEKVATRHAEERQEHAERHAEERTEQADTHKGERRDLRTSQREERGELRGQHRGEISELRRDHQDQRAEQHGNHREEIERHRQGHRDEIAELHNDQRYEDARRREAEEDDGTKSWRGDGAGDALDRLQSAADRFLAFAESGGILQPGRKAAVVVDGVNEDGGDDQDRDA